MAAVWVRALWRCTLLSLVLLTFAGCKGDPDKKRAPPCYTSEDCIPEGKDADCLEGICENNECIFESLEDGLECDDGDLLTRGDACNAGECVGTEEEVISCDEEPGPCEELETDPETGVCSLVAKPDGEPCDDDDMCTQLDSCESGECVGSEPVDCSATDDCHEDGECDPETGECSAPEAPDGTSCDDGLICTEDDVCESGACAGAPVVCDDEQECSVDACQEDAGGCTYDMDACVCESDGDCDDGNPCNGVETCDVESGSCQAGEAIVCDMLDDECTRGMCDPETAECVAAPAADGTACEDGDLCTEADTCQEGACVGGGDVVCVPLNGCHNPGICDPATGLCDNPQREDGSDCTDDNACTEGDTCEAGACVGGEPRVCEASDQCHTAGTCDPANGACTNPPIFDGAACDDGDLCTETDSCQSGECVGDDPIVCTAADDCHLAGQCNPSTGVCSNPVAEDGTSCSDGLLCTSGDQCVSGSCEGDGVTCNDNVACTADSCSETVGGCVFDTTSCPCTTSSECNDNNPCNGVETCNLSTNTCVAGTPMDCTHLGDACNTGSCQPETGQCRAVPRANGTTCNDGNLCTQTDACQAGQCVGQSPIRCVAQDQCHNAGVCNPNTGTCSNPVKANDAPCDDGNLCTQSDACQAGACVGASPVVCLPSSQCHNAGSCNPATGACSSPAKQNGAACDDGNLCTLNDGCQGGVCTSNSAVSCSASDQCHTQGTCNPSSGVCSNPVRPNGSPCNDSNLCTQSDTCQAGACQGANNVVCTAQDQCHVVGTCNSQTGVCNNPNAPNGTSCDDGDLCTQTDECTSGACVGSAPVTCTAIDQCHAAGACDPLSGDCSTPALPNGTGCNDSNQCTRTDQCTDGACVGSNPVVCNPLSQCHNAGTCNPNTGACTNPQKSNGSACDDGLNCTNPDTCQGGECGGAQVACNDSIACTVDSCVEPGGCSFDTSNCGCSDNSDCNDGNPCNGVETCNLQTLTCQNGTALDCSSETDACNVGACDPSTGACVAQPRANGTSCNDGNQCTQTDACQAGVCTGSNPVTCTAQSQCHDVGTCNPQTGACTNPAKQNGASCNDSNLCTRTDTCQAGVCTGSNPVTCTAQSQCHDVGTCNPQTGACTNPVKQNGASCNDSNACTQTDTCVSGVCQGGNPVTCTAPDDCHSAGTCDRQTGLCSAPQLPDRTGCNDGDLCTQTDTCQAGVCVGGNPVNCVAQDDCHLAGTCNPASGTCSTPTAPQGTTCDDDNLCTQSDSCDASGNCVGAQPVTCTALSQCHVAGTCNPNTGSCSNPPAPGTTACNDSDACTTGETCSGDASASCGGGTTVSCPPASGQCKLSSCDSDQGCIETNRPDSTSCNDNSQCTLVDVCRAGVCAGGSRRDNSRGAWTDAPGMTATQRVNNGPHSIDLFTHSKGAVGAVGTYSGAIAFNDLKTGLGLSADCAVGLYWVAYEETTGVVSNLANIGCGSGTVTVTHATHHIDDGFTIVGQFSGSVAFGLASSTMSVTAEKTTELFIARYKPSGDIGWVVRGMPGGNQGTVDSVAAFDDESVVVLGTADENISFFGVDGKELGATPSNGVWTALFAAGGGLDYAERVVTPSQGVLPTARAVTAHSDGRWTMTGTFQGTDIGFGPSQEAVQSSLGGADVWVLDLAQGKFNWVARVGSEAASDASGDVEAIRDGAVMLLADTRGATPSADDVSSTLLLREVGPRLNTHVLRFEADGQLSRAALIADPDSGFMDSYQVGLDPMGAISVAGTFLGRVGLYSDVGFGGGAPPNASDIILPSDALALMVARLDEGCRVQWAIPAGGVGSGMTGQAGWDIVATDHPSRAITVAGMFSTQASFGYSVTDTLTPKGAPGTPFVAHLNSEAALDYCP